MKTAQFTFNRHRKKTGSEKKKKLVFDSTQGQKMEDSLKFLSGIFELLVDGNVFETKSTDLKSIVDFKHPKELKVRQTLV